MNTSRHIPPPFFINHHLYKHVQTFAETLPKDGNWDVFKTLMESLLFALRNGENPSHLAKRIRRQRNKTSLTLEPLSHAQAVSDLEAIKRLHALAQTRTLIPGNRSLDRYRQEIQQLRNSGASQNDIRLWLLANRNCKVSQPTLHRYLKTYTATP